LYLRDTKVII